MNALRIFFCLAVLLSSVAVPARAQRFGDVSGRQFDVELGGAGILFSVNFDSRFERGQRLGPGYRVGIGCAKGGLLVSGASDRLSDRGYVTIPAGVNWVFGKPGSSHTFEMGAAITCFTEKVDVHYADEFVDGRYCAGSLSFMYRFSPVKGGFACRIGLTPLFNFAGNTAIRMGASAGYAF